jgi:4a-hydroxytetrahydrobiopterin dehydratase
MALHQETCIPCQAGSSELNADELLALSKELPEWDIKEGHHLHRQITFQDFSSAMTWLNCAAAICEEQGHHADFKVGWGYVEIDIFTHKVDGLTRSDAVLAAKLDTIKG